MRKHIGPRGILLTALVLAFMFATATTAFASFFNDGGNLVQGWPTFQYVSGFDSKPDFPDCSAEFFTYGQNPLTTAAGPGQPTTITTTAFVQPGDATEWPLESTAIFYAPGDQRQYNPNNIHVIPQVGPPADIAYSVGTRPDKLTVLITNTTPHDANGVYTGFCVFRGVPAQGGGQFNPNTGVNELVDHKDAVTGTLIEPSTKASISIAPAQKLVSVGTTITLNLGENNDGVGRLTTCSVDVYKQQVSAPADPSWVPIAGGHFNIGTLFQPPGLPNSWTGTLDYKVMGKTNFRIVGHGFDGNGNEVTWFADPVGAYPNIHDEDEQAFESVDVFTPTTTLKAAPMTVSKSPVKAGTSITIAGSEMNDGDVALTDCYVELFFDPTGPDPAVSVSTQTTATIAAGASRAFSFNDSPAVDGTYIAIGHGLDPDKNDITTNLAGTTGDTDEINSVPVDVFTPTTTLQVAGLTIDPAGPVAPGTDVTISGSEMNDGDVALTDCYVELFAKKASDANFVSVSTQTTATIAAGASRAFSFTYNVTEPTDFKVIGHGLDPDKNDITTNLAGTTGDTDEIVSGHIDTGVLRGVGKITFGSNGKPGDPLGNWAYSGVAINTAYDGSAKGQVELKSMDPAKHNERVHLDVTYLAVDFVKDVRKNHTSIAWIGGVVKHTTTSGFDVGDAVLLVLQDNSEPSLRAPDRLTPGPILIGDASEALSIADQAMADPDYPAARDAGDDNIPESAKDALWALVDTPYPLTYTWTQGNVQIHKANPIK